MSPVKMEKGEGKRIFVDSDDDDDAYTESSSDSSSDASSSDDEPTAKTRKRRSNEPANSSADTKPNNNRMEPLQSMMKESFNNALLSDITIFIKGLSFPAHSFVLAAQCNFFQNALTKAGPKNQARKEFHYEEWQPHACWRMFEYLYKGTYSVGPVPEIKEPDERPAHRHILVYAVAETFGVEGLQTLATERFSECIKREKIDREFVECVRRIYKVTDIRNNMLRILYNVSVGVFTRGTIVLIDLLKKAVEHGNADSLPSATLIEDMKPLSFHVQSVWNTANLSLKRFGIESVESWDDEGPVTMSQLIERAEKLKAFLEGIDPVSLQGKDRMEMKVMGEMRTGRHFILSLGMPNFFFHLQTVYSILRMKGVPLGKDDYLVVAFLGQIPGLPDAGHLSAVTDKRRATGDRKRRQRWTTPTTQHEICSYNAIFMVNSAAMPQIIESPERDAADNVQDDATTMTITISVLSGKTKQMLTHELFFRFYYW
ncbi:hypothetical protein PWT90_03467 [Aphanocladium album]|nr:hypothetical protein PWT90_03467 [Aphanocladium album]